MFRALSIISLFCFALFAGCSNIDDFNKDAGSPKKIERSLDHFTQISVGEKFYVSLKNDTNLPETIEIDYFEHLNAKISTTVENGILTIKDQNAYNWTRDLNVRPKLTINVHTLNNLDIQGACELNCIDTIFTNQLTINMHSVKPAKIKVDCGNLYGGSNNLAPVFFEGRGTIFSWSCEQGSWIDASKLKCDDAYIRHFTKQDIYISPEKVLEVFIYNSGNVYYKPFTFNKFTVKELGSGKAILY
jgi:hypothetical protein